MINDSDSLIFHVIPYCAACTCICAGQLINMRQCLAESWKLWKQKKWFSNLWKKNEVEENSDTGVEKQGNSQNVWLVIHSVFTCPPVFSVCWDVCLVSAPGASCSSLLWRRKGKRKPEIAHTHTYTHTGYSHVYTIRFFPSQGLRSSFKALLW